jgi:hypothetical protein
VGSASVPWLLRGSAKSLPVKGGTVRKGTVFVAGVVTAVSLQAAGVLAAPSARQAGAAATPKKQPVVLGFYRGETVRYFDFGRIRLKPGNTVSPVWTFTNGAAGQRDIVDVVPGQARYSALWQLNRVTWADASTPRVLRSAAQVRKAGAGGELTIRKAASIVNRTLLGFGQMRHPGFSRGKTVRYYELGAVKVAPGNEILPIWTVTNGVKGQRNLAEVTPGQTAYPPLWGIIEVTWSQSADKRLLTSVAALKKAQAAGEVTVQKTPLVVNCPLV